MRKITIPICRIRKLSITFLGKSGEESERAQHWTRGVLSVFAKNTEGAGNFVYGVLNSVNQIVFNDRVSAGVTIAIGSLIYLLIAIHFYEGFAYRTVSVFA